MSVTEQLRILFVLGPIATLLVVGLGLTLHSGLMGLNTGPWLRRLAGNLSGTLLRLAGWVVGLGLLQQLVGFRVHLPW